VETMAKIDRIGKRSGILTLFLGHRIDMRD